MSMRERALGSFFSGTFLMPRTIIRNIIQKIKMMMRAPINLKRFSQVTKLITQLKKEEVCSISELPAFLNPSDTSSILFLLTYIRYYTLIALRISSRTDIPAV